MGRKYLHPRHPNSTRKDQIYWRRRRERLSNRSFLNFDGATTAIQTTYLLSEAANVTITAMFRATGLGGAAARVLLGLPNTAAWFLAIREANADTQVRIFRASGVDNGTFTGLVNDQDYKLKIWADGDAAADLSIDDATDIAVTNGGLSVNGNLLIGDRQSGTNWLGRIWDVKVYTGDSEDAGDLIHHWPINEGSGTVINDIVGGADGTLVLGGGTWETET